MTFGKKPTNPDIEKSIWRFIFGVLYIITLVASRLALPYLAPKYGIFSEELDSVTNLVGIACIYQATSLIGYFINSCISHKYDFSVPFIIQTVIGTLITAYGLHRIHNKHILNEVQVLQLAQNQIRLSDLGHIPLWLQKVQLSDIKCCGIISFRDYFAFLYPPNVRSEASVDVPYSCCHDSKQGKEFKCRGNSENNYIDEDGLSGIFLRPDGNVNGDGWNETLNSINNVTEENLYKFYGKFREEAKTEIEGGNFLASQLLPVNSSKLGNFHTQGCYDALTEQTNLLYQVYFIFLLFITFMSWVFVRAFLTQRESKSRKNKKKSANVSTKIQNKNMSEIKKKTDGKFSARNKKKREKQKEIQDLLKR